MQHDIRPVSSVVGIAAKELGLFFGSPVGYLFIGSFVAVTLFVFFWGEAFFSRNIADVRPLFEWMPLLLIFLASTLTMRMWSEERRSGTLEYLLTRPVPAWHFVLGKFFACLTLLAIALLITLPLPLSVSLMADLDWGPVWAGYLATLLLGAAYLAIGLFVSSRSDNQIVSLIASVAVCGIFYLIGTSTVTDFLGNRGGEWMRLLGTGSRFDSIARGVIDFRDLYYYLSIVVAFLALNTYVLERERWADGSDTTHHRHWRLGTALLVGNALAANLWLGQLDGLRLDATRGQQYSISDATDSYLTQLREPLLLRGYFSARTHPLLAPLVPQLTDLLKEYEVAGNGRVRVEVIDPVDNPELEEEANQKFAIRPVPFQVADRYQSSIVSSYFDLLVQYGDEYQVLGFRDLIEVRAGSEGDIEVQLRNPEHDITRSIRKVLNSYRAGGNLFETVRSDIAFTGYVSDASKLPEELRTFSDEVRAVTEEPAAESGGRMTVEFVDPEANGAEVAQRINEDYGFQPMATSLFSDERFYFYLTLQGDDTLVQIPLDDISEASFERNLTAAIKRFASGFTKTIGWVAPQPDPVAAQYGMRGPQFNQLRSLLASELNIQNEDLGDGTVSGDTDLLVLLAPEGLDEKSVFAVDQFLMQGGTVIVASSPYQSTLTGGGLSLREYDSGLEDWLGHHGLDIEHQLVMDPQNAAFPLPVTRNLGGFQVQELAMVDYPYFPDIRGSGINADNPVTADLPQVTMAWPSPIALPRDIPGRTFTPLLRSSDGAWLSTSTDVTPQLGPGGVSAYRPEGSTGTHVLGVVATGRFDSYFADKDSPLLSQEGDETTDPESETESASTPAGENPLIAPVIRRSPESARLIVFSSSDFLRDQITSMLGAASSSEYANHLELVANTIDWSLQDESLLSIRSRGHFNRTLPPMEKQKQIFWEYLNYGLAAFILLAVALLIRRWQRRRSTKLAALISA